MSTKAHAKVLSVDASKCEECPGFVRYFGHEDVPGHNDIGSIIHDEEVFVTSEAKHFGAVSDTAPLIFLSVGQYNVMSFVTFAP
jgi:xanthine dehydrogenase molybdopterin-binding subunit B